MATEAEKIEHLIRSAYPSLVPASAPPLRNLDVSYRADRSQLDSTAFCDAFWAQPGRFACCAIRIGGGSAGRLGAHALKAVLRAAVRRHPADQALALGLQAFHAHGSSSPVDAAVAAVLTRDGTATVGTHGSGAALRFSADSTSPVAVGARARLARGEALLLSVGIVGPALRPVPVPTDATDLVRASVADAPGSAAAAIVLRDLSDGGAGTFVLLNDVKEISPLLDDVGVYLAARGVGTDAWAALEVALDELLTNIVLHAYRDGAAHEIVVDVRTEGGVLCAEIRDDGIPFDPTSIPSPDLEADLDDRSLGGLGLHFARTVFDAISYRRVRGWNVLAVAKSFAGAPT